LLMGVLHKSQMDEVLVTRILSLIYNPNRYRSKAAEAFSNEILPSFATYSTTQDKKEAQAIDLGLIEIATPNSGGS